MERRGFLKTLAGAGLGAGMLSAWGAATPAQAAGLEDCLAVVVDVDACTGCGASGPPPGSPSRYRPSRLPAGAGTGNPTGGDGATSRIG